MNKSEHIGRTAFVRYQGGATGEEPCDNFAKDKPVEVVLGVGELPKGIDDAFLSMEVGEERRATIPCSLGFGEYDSSGVQTYSRAYAEGFETLEAGDIITWTNPASGMRIPVRVIEADAQLITLDFNHPLAGKELTYWLQLVDLV